MELSPLLSAARDQLGRGDTGQALAILLSAVEHNTLKASALQRTLRVIEANYQAVRQKELKGIIAFDEAQREYNRINDTLLAVLDDLAAGREPAAAAAPPGTLRWWLIGAGVLVLAGILAAVWLSRPERRPAVATQSPRPEAALECPTFDKDRLRVLVLPFQSVDDQRARPELVLQTRIRELAGRNEFPVDIEVFGGELSESGTPDIRSAGSYAQRCDADLVLWGIYEKKPGTAAIDVDINYAFVRGARQSGATGFRRFASLSALKSGRVQKDFDDAVFSLCAIMALRENNPQLAVKWLAKVKQKGKIEEELLRAAEGK